MTASNPSVTPAAEGSDLKLKFVGALVEQLGAQLYPSATATVAELISNAWDADANSVWVTVPLGETWTQASEIVVIDDGNGMTREEARLKYLIVGRKRRVEDGQTSEGGREVHGRKGIGKLAAFGTAGRLECFTLRDGTATAFGLDYDEIRQLEPGQDYDVREAEDNSPLMNPLTGGLLDHGTRITLRNLRLRRALAQDRFVDSMSRRFSLGTAEMAVTINGQPLERFNVLLEFQFPRDGVPDDSNVQVADGWAIENLPDGNQVRWWIGFTPKPLEEESFQGVSILARGKMAQRPFMFGRSQGVEGQLGQEYLVGEVVADWIDQGSDIGDDLIQANRDGLQLEDERLQALMEWGRKRLGWSLRRRQRLRVEKRYEEIDTGSEIAALIQPFARSERGMFRRLAKDFGRNREIEPEDVVDFVGQVVNAYNDASVRDLIEAIEAEDDVQRQTLWTLVHEFGLIDARRKASIIEARLATIDQLEKAVQAGALEVPDLHSIVKANPWLLDPRWDLLDDEVRVTDLDAAFKPEEDEDGLRLDFIFVLAPRAPASVDQVVVVEIKRGYSRDGQLRRASDTEVGKFQDYVLAVQEFYERLTPRPAVIGLLVAEDYTRRAMTKKKQLEQIADPRYLFKTWAQVVDDTDRFHRGWLEVSRRRSGNSDGSSTP